jgi:glycosyltransferase involved in cell wall biosynthesis
MNINKAENKSRVEISLVELFDRAREAFAEGDFCAAILPERFSETVLAVSRCVETGERPASPVASIVIASYRAEPNLAPALAEVARQAEQLGAEVILVDNGNPELHRHAAVSLSSFLTITPPMQAGCSLARNLGALCARAEHVIFVDDDGILERCALRALLATVADGVAVAARGRVVPLTDPALTAAHYDLGEMACTSLITAEGISAWNRSVFLEAGGFDPLLAGHEGLALSWKIWRFHGPHSMLYEPTAVLYHDFAPDKTQSETKKLRHRRNADYLAIHAPRAAKLHEARLKGDNFLRETILNQPAPRRLTEQRVPVSVLTTVRNGLSWVEDFTRCWKAQTVTDFQLIVVDDGSLDGTSDRLASLWEGDRRLTLVRAAGRGRGAALNTAVEHAWHDICLVADVDDISIPRRIEVTQGYFADHPGRDWVSFVAFTEDNHYRIGFPSSLAISDLGLRCLFGMPASFPTTAFRRSRFSVPFDVELRAGVDCDWVRRNLQNDPTIAGELVQSPLVFYRIHGNQLSAVYRRDQESARSSLINFAYQRILGAISAADQRWISILADNRDVTADERRDLSKWIARVLQLNLQGRAFDPQALALLMQDAFARLRLRPSPAQPVNESKLAPPVPPRGQARPAAILRLLGWR